jgi:hypothetical protein
VNESEIGFRPETPAKLESDFCNAAKIQIRDHFPFYRELRLKLDRLSLEDTEGFCDDGSAITESLRLPCPDGSVARGIPELSSLRKKLEPHFLDSRIRDFLEFFVKGMM